MPSKALVEAITEAGGVPVPAEPAETAIEWEDDGTSAIAPIWPSLKIVQGVSKMEGAIRHIGEFWRSDTGDFYPEAVITPLVQMPYRALFVSGSDEVQCSSADGISPLPGGRYWEDRNLVAPDLCDDCALSRFSRNQQGRWVRPECSAGWVVIAIHDGAIVRLRISGSNLRTWEEFVGSHISRLRRRLCQVRITLTTEERVSGANKWMGLVIANVEPVPQEEAAELNELVRFARESYRQRSHEYID